jgi:anti-sigma factor RsiW
VQHLIDDSLEQYVLLTLPESDLQAVEEHLLTCAKCRRRLQETEEYIAAMRLAAARLREPERIGKR